MVHEVRVCETCGVNKIQGLICCWDCWNKGHDSNTSDICSCGVHVRKGDISGDCKHYDPENFHKCSCGKSIPMAVNKCYRCATTKPNLKKKQTEKIGEVEYQMLEFERNHSERLDKSDWDMEWRKAYYHNRIDMALISGDKHDFRLYSMELKRLEESLA